MKERVLIELDRAFPTYSPGETVSGRVNLLIKDNDHIKGISLTLRGSSKVYWTEHQRRIRSGDGDETETMPRDSVPFTSSECYLNTTYLAPTLAFGAGPLQVPFDLTLPDPLPASFEGEFGRVRYKIIVRVKRLNRSSDFKCERPFVVRGVKDLNDWPFASDLSWDAKTTQLGYLCCLSGPIVVRAWMEPSGYVAGQTLHFHTDVENNSGRRLCASLELVRVEKYYARGQIKITCKVLDRWNLTANVDTWRDVSVRIPSTVPSGFPHCGNIEVDYVMKLTIDPGTWHKNITLSLMVYIGSIGLRGAESVPQQLALLGLPPPYPEAVNSQAPLPSERDSPPPPYQEAANAP